ncbi:hypothetical protein JXA80_02440 [bacterium]|nr:hypothetical protein [candidate division CSSED10-310 bacterium]
MDDNQRTNGSAILFLTILTGFFFFHAVDPGHIFFYLDHAFQNIPFRYFAYQSFSGGTMPIWCPFSAAGFPFFAEGQSGIASPINWFFYSSLPFSSAYNASLIIHVLFLGIGTFYSFRRFRCSPAGAFTAAVACAFSGYVIRKLMFVNYIQALAYLPWLIFILTPQSGFKRIPWDRIAIGGALFGGLCLCGHPQVIMIGVIAMLLHSAFSPQQTPLQARLALVIAVIVVGSFIGAAQILPTWELMTCTPRYLESAETLSGQMSMPPAYLPLMIFKDVFGNAAYGTFNQNLWPAYEWELNGFFGMVLFLLAVLADFSDRRVRFFFGCVLIGITLSFGLYSPIDDLLQHVPILNAFRAPVRWNILTVWGVCGLAALALTRLQTRLTDGSQGRTLRSIRVRLTGVSLCTLGVLLVLIGDGRDTMRSGGIGGLIFLGLTSAAFAMVSIVRKPGLLVVFPMLVFSELYWAHAGYVPVAEEALILGKPNDIDRVREHGGTILSLIHESSPDMGVNWHGGWAMASRSDYGKVKDAYPMYAGMIHRIPLVTFNEWSPLHYSGYIDWGRHMLINDRAVIESFDIGTVVAPRDLPLYRGDVLSENHEWEMRTFHRPNDSGGRFVIPNEARLDGSNGWPAWNRRYIPGTVTIETMNPLPGKDAWVREGYFRSDRRSINCRGVEIDSAGWACIQLPETFDVGWRVSGDLQEVSSISLHRGNGLFQTVICPPGRHRFSLVYEPISYRLGWFLTCTGIMGTLLCAGAGWVQSRKSGFSVTDAVQCGGPGIIWKLWVIAMIGINTAGYFLKTDLWMDTLFNWVC